jgi:hypothetical protein
MDVEFTVEVLKGKTISWPRAEDASSSWPSATRDRSTRPFSTRRPNLMHLLAEDHGLDYRASSALLGQCIRYDVGNVYDPAYTAVAKIAKDLLP